MPTIPGIPNTTNRTNTPAERLINGTEIQVASEILPVAAHQEIGYLQPVTLDDDGKVIPCQVGTPAIGLSMGYIMTDDAEATISVLRAGVLNPDAIAFDSSYDTAAQKAAAFRGAPAPTNIIVKASI